jgi:hypothetical protein
MRVGFDVSWALALNSTSISVIAGVQFYIPAKGRVAAQRVSTNAASR